MADLRSSAPVALRTRRGAARVAQVALILNLSMWRQSRSCRPGPLVKTMTPRLNQERRWHDATTETHGPILAVQVASVKVVDGFSVIPV